MSHQKIQILFVCTQNVFRSLSAKKLLDKYLLEKKDTRFEIHSAKNLDENTNTISWDSSTSLETFTPNSANFSSV